MPAPDVGRWLDTLYVVGAGITALLVGAWATITRFKRRSHNGDVTKSDLVELHREIDGERGMDRHYVRNDLQKLSAQNELECQRVENNVAEAVKGLAFRLDAIDRRLGGLESSCAVLADRSERVDRLEERLERVEGRRR